jgi:predicted type IV restriction endonuclease
MDGNIMAARNGLIILSMNSIAPQIFMSTLIKTGGPRRIRNYDLLIKRRFYGGVRSTTVTDGDAPYNRKSRIEGNLIDGNITVIDSSSS